MTDRITTLAELEARYGEPGEPARVKELDRIIPEYKAFIEASTFMVLATAGPGGLDCSPRGDPAGFVRVPDERTLLIPDRRGNNRIDSLRNILADPRVGLLFLVPGIGETIRVNGRADIMVEPALLDGFAMDGKAPRSVLAIAVETVYFQCSKAIMRSRLWDPGLHLPRHALPSPGQILKACTAGRLDAAEIDRTYPDRVKTTMY